MANYLEIIQGLNKIPGIGRKSAERITFYLLESDLDKTNELLAKIKAFVNSTQKCKICGLISKNNPCNICSSTKRDKNIICLVKSVQDALTIERSKSYYGVYHVLGKILSPLNDTYENDLNLEKLLKRINPQTKEIIFALENNQHSRATRNFIMEKIKENWATIRFSHIAIGVPLGVSLEYLDKETIKSSLTNRFSI